MGLFLEGVCAPPPPPSLVSVRLPAHTQNKPFFVLGGTVTHMPVKIMTQSTSAVKLSPFAGLIFFIRVSVVPHSRTILVVTLVLLIRGSNTTLSSNIGIIYVTEK